MFTHCQHCQYLVQILISQLGPRMDTAISETALIIDPNQSTPMNATHRLRIQRTPAAHYILVNGKFVFH